MQAIRYFIELLFPPRPSERIVSELKPGELVRKMRIRVIPEHSITYLLSFSDTKVRACIHEVKFHDTGAARQHLAAVLRAHVRRIADEYILVPVPLSAKRRKERGYNQVERILEEANLGFTPLLERTRNTDPQTTLPKHRRLQNLKGAFVCTQPLSPIPIYVLIDDVATTGATLTEAKHALFAAGARRFLLLSLSH